MSEHVKMEADVEGDSAHVLIGDALVCCSRLAVRMAAGETHPQAASQELAGVVSTLLTALARASQAHKVCAQGVFTDLETQLICSLNRN
jgi:hypothetical protein